MKILITLISILLFILSCNKVDKKEYVEELVIFGHSGFCVKDTDNEIFDTTRLDVRRYFEYKRNSFIRIARRNFNKNTEYLSVNSSDTFGIDKLVNNAFINKAYNTEYYSDSPGLNEGLPCILYYMTSNKKGNLIYYDHYYLPDTLKNLDETIENLILKDDLKPLAKFELNNIVKDVKKDFYKIYLKEPKKIRETIKYFLPQGTHKNRLMKERKNDSIIDSIINK